MLFYCLQKPEQILDTIHSRCQHVYFKPIDKEKFINRLVEQNMSKPVAEMISTYTTQIDNAMALNEEFDLLALRKSVIRWCGLLLTNKPMALIGIIDLLKQAKNKTAIFNYCSCEWFLRRYHTYKGKCGG